MLISRETENVTLEILCQRRRGSHYLLRLAEPRI